MKLLIFVHFLPLTVSGLYFQDVLSFTANFKHDISLYDWQRLDILVPGNMRLILPRIFHSWNNVYIQCYIRLGGILRAADHLQATKPVACHLAITRLRMSADPLYTDLAHFSNLIDEVNNVDRLMTVFKTFLSYRSDLKVLSHLSLLLFNPKLSSDLWKSRFLISLDRALVFLVDTWSLDDTNTPYILLLKKFVFSAVVYSKFVCSVDGGKSSTPCYLSGEEGLGIVLDPESNSFQVKQDEVVVSFKVKRYGVNIARVLAVARSLWIKIQETRILTEAEFFSILMNFIERGYTEKLNMKIIDIFLANDPDLCFIPNGLREKIFNACLLQIDILQKILRNRVDGVVWDANARQWKSVQETQSERPATFSDMKFGSSLGYLLALTRFRLTKAVKNTGINSNEILEFLIGLIKGDDEETRVVMRQLWLLTESPGSLEYSIDLTGSKVTFAALLQSRFVLHIMDGTEFDFSCFKSIVNWQGDHALEIAQNTNHSMELDLLVHTAVIESSRISRPLKRIRVFESLEIVDT